MKRNSRNINRNFWALAVILCLGLIVFSPFTTQATDPGKTGPMDPGSAVNAALATITVPVFGPKDCHAEWKINNSTTGMIYLGEVSGFLVNKKQACKLKAQAACNRTEVVNLVKNNVPANQACPGGVDVYFDTKVEDKINSRDGYCKVSLPCHCSGWSYN